MAGRAAGAVEQLCAFGCTEVAESRERGLLGVSGEGGVPIYIYI